MSDVAASMDYEIVWLGYNDKPNYDRIWGFLKMTDGRHYVFWGVKGKRQQFKLQNDWMTGMLINQQENKGYKKIEPAHYELLVPSFREDLELWLMTNILADTFR